MIDEDKMLEEGAWQQEVQARLQKQLEIPALSNSAIVLCRKAMERSARETMNELHLHLPGEAYDPNEEQLDPEQIRIGAQVGTKRANKAYCEAMPPLSYAGNIRDFIACVGHGMLIGVFQPEEASRLLYAAQVATSAESKRYKSKIG